MFFRNSEETRQYWEICTQLKIDKKNVLLLHDEILGKGSSSTVITAIIKHASALMPYLNFLERTSVDELSVAAKKINRLEHDEIQQLYGELDTARRLQNHPNICALIGWTYHLDVPCLLFERMDMNLLTYLIKLRIPDADVISVSTSSQSQSLSNGYVIPDFDEDQQKIFLQILWNAAQGMTYIAARGIAHR